MGVNHVENVEVGACGRRTLCVCVCVCVCVFVFQVEPVKQGLDSGALFLFDVCLIIVFLFLMEPV